MPVLYESAAYSALLKPCASLVRKRYDVPIINGLRSRMKQGLRARRPALYASRMFTRGEFNMIQKARAPRADRGWHWYSAGEFREDLNRIGALLGGFTYEVRSVNGQNYVRRI